MANNGGPMYPIPGVTRHDGMSVRDGFAMEIAGRLYATVTADDDAALAREIYDFAQLMIVEKLRRDKADRDEGKPG